MLFRSRGSFAEKSSGSAARIALARLGYIKVTAEVNDIGYLWSTVNHWVSTEMEVKKDWG